MRIILIGPSGIGKTSIGRVIAQKLEEEFYDMDFLLHNNFNYPQKDTYSKDEIFEKKKLEIDILGSVLKKENFILSTCGGLIEEQIKDNISTIKELFKHEQNIILLLSYEDLIASKKLLMKRFQVHAISKERSLKFDRDISIFKKLTNKIIYCKDSKIEEIIDEILKIIK